MVMVTGGAGFSGMVWLDLGMHEALLKAAHWIYREYLRRVLTDRLLP